MAEPRFVAPPGSPGSPADAARTPDEPPTLTDLSLRSLNAFQELLTACANVPGAVKLDDVDNGKLIEECGRLKIWTEQTGSALSQRGSLEERLRDDMPLRNSIAGVLMQLSSQLSSAKAMLTQRSSTTHEEASSASSTSDSEFSNDSAGNFSTSTNPHRRISRLGLLLAHAFENIRLLYYYSALLRRPRLKGRYIHSSILGASSPRKPEPYEISHIEQKLKAWLQPHELDEDPENALETGGLPEKQGLVPNPSDDSDELCLRLAAANGRRREQLRYWEKHPCIAPEQPMSTGLDKPGEMGTAPALAAALSESKSQASSQNTIRTGVTGSSVARSAIIETKMVATQRTVYADSTVGDDTDAIRVPKVPDESLQGLTFECPFCHMRLESIQMQDRNSWKRHVFRDLRPYTCTFDDCSNPHKLYATRRDWVNHETQVHYRQWTCRLCPDAYYDTRTDMASHIEASHPELGGQRLSLSIEIGEGSMDEARKRECTFCRKTLSLKRLMDHVAGHMEELALFALPIASTVPPDQISVGSQPEQEDDADASDDLPAMHGNWTAASIRYISSDSPC